MKNLTMMRPNYSVSSFLVVMFLLIVNCSSKQNRDEEKSAVPEASNVGYEVSEDKVALAGYYKLEHIKDWYPERILPPVFDYNVDLSNKSVVELSLLRNEIFARNGYLFDDAVLRGYFNQFKWYQPIFEVPEFAVQLNKQEQEFVTSVLARENELSKQRYIEQGDYSMINVDHVFNMMQFKQVDDNLKKILARNNFAITPAKNEQLFHVYDQNHYQYIPNFITTDLYLQVMHKHFSSLLQKIEEEKFIPLLTDMLDDLYTQSVQFQKAAGDENLSKAAQWSKSYLAVALGLIKGQTSIAGDIEAQTEIKKILSASGVGSKFLDSDLIQYSQFKARGNYTKTVELERYFRCVKWLNTAPIVISDDQRFLSAILIASFIRKSPQSLPSFQRYNEAIRFIVGDEDNLSIATLLSVLSNEDVNDLSALTDATKLADLKRKLMALNVDKIRPKGGDELTKQKLASPSILFTAGRYTFDAEILSRLTHILKPDPKRPFPRGLDVFASLGNDEAKNILLNEYAEEKTWKAYPDSLQALREKFSSYAEWDKNLYTKTMSAISKLQSVSDDGPMFMKTPAWSRKNLNSSLASWAEVKHDMQLYSEEPNGAQAGEGGGPPAPQHISYVEPNIAFWETSLQLLDFQQAKLTDLDLLNTDVRRILDELKQIGSLLLTTSKKELAKEKITNEEFDKLAYLGGQIEYLTFRIFNSSFLPEKERYVALIADVYNYNGVYLEEAVGMVDEIYVVAEINGKPYLTKGAVLSYYEFTSESPLTDEEWIAKITSGNAVARPVWMKDIIVNAKSLESKPAYSF